MSKSTPQEKQLKDSQISSERFKTCEFSLIEEKTTSIDKKCSKWSAKYNIEDFCKFCYLYKQRKTNQIIPL